MNQIAPRSSSLGLPRPAWGPLLGLAVLLAAVLIALAHGYGPHRDELYFVVAGDHLAWSYPDQGPLTPLIARVVAGIAPGSLTLLRAPSALMAGGCVVVSGLIAREFGGSRRAQLIAAGCTAASPVLLAVGHLLSTTTYDLLAWSLVSWLVVRAVRTEDRLPWVAAGVISGTALLNKPLIALLLASIGLGLCIAGPRSVLRRWEPWAAGALALLIWAPWLRWQAGHGWPQLHISSSIASGGSATSQPRWAFVPFQFLLAGPPVAPVWLAGILALARAPELSRYRCLAVSWLLLLMVFELAGGKPYYLMGLLPMLFAAGSLSADHWLMRGRKRLRLGALVAAVAVGAAAAAVIDLPVLPVRSAGAAVAMNADVGETIGWPDFVAQVDRSFARAPHPAIIFTENYGEAGAVDRYGSALGLPRAYSGHNGFGLWGVPPDANSAVVAVGLSRPRLARFFRDCRVVDQITNRFGIDNEERGNLIAVCAAPVRPWSVLWPDLRHLS